MAPDHNSALARRHGCLVLKDGTVMHGNGLGAQGTAAGEVVFNTSLTGYPEILTDPSYAGQMVTLTQTQVGNYGVTLADLEADRPAATGLIIRAPSLAPSNWRADLDLDGFLRGHGVVALSGVDTRALVRHLRTVGAQPGVLWAGATGQQADVPALLRQAEAAPDMAGQEWVSRVTCSAAHAFSQTPELLPGQGTPFANLPQPKTRPHVVAFDLGAKRNILRLLCAAGFRVTVVPAHTTAAEVRALSPDGVFLSNGPGDPATLDNLCTTVASLLGTFPVFGICLGHQVVARAVGARTFKLRFGHRGGNQPVLDVASGRVQVTSQNHGFAVDPSSLPAGVTVSEINLSDGTVEGLSLPAHRAFTVQYHPEAAPGPHDTRHHFISFRHMILGGTTGATPSDHAIGQLA